MNERQSIARRFERHRDSFLSVTSPSALDSVSAAAASTYHRAVVVGLLPVPEVAYWRVWDEESKSWLPTCEYSKWWTDDPDPVESTRLRSLVWELIKNSYGDRDEGLPGMAGVACEVNQQSLRVYSGRNLEVEKTRSAELCACLAEKILAESKPIGREGCEQQLISVEAIALFVGRTVKTIQNRFRSDPSAPHPVAKSRYKYSEVRPWAMNRWGVPLPENYDQMCREYQAKLKESQTD